MFLTFRLVTGGLSFANVPLIESEESEAARARLGSVSVSELASGM